MLSAENAARRAEALSQAIKLEPDVQRALWAMVPELKKAFPVDRVLLARVAGGRATIVASWSSVPNEMIPGMSVEIEGSPLARVMEQRSAIVHESPRVRRRWFGSKTVPEPLLKSTMTAPLVAGDSVMALVGVASRRRGAYAPHHRAWFEQFCAGLPAALGRFFPLEPPDSGDDRLLQDQRERFILISTLAHELRTPLTAIVASGGLLLEELANDSEPRRKLAENIVAGADRMHVRLTELLDAARSEKAGFAIRRQMIDLRPLLENAASQLTPIAAGQNQTMAVQIQDDIPLVLADRGRIEQVVVNLLGNAIKFTPRGGRISLALRKRPNVVVVEVSDTGPGIPATEQPSLFQPYYRVESDRERVPGLGLGLALCKRIIELHGGNIWVESRPGAGATFFFSLPVDAAAMPPA